MILRIIRCDVCGATHAERTPGEGFPGWGELRGVQEQSLGITDPALCPAHLAQLLDVFSKMYALNESLRAQRAPR